MRIVLVFFILIISACSSRHEVAVTYVKKGVHEESLGNYSAAIIDYTSAIQLDPSFAEAYNNRGYAKFELSGDTSGALADYKKAIELKPDLSMSFYNIGYVLILSGKYDQAIEYTNKAILLKDSTVNFVDAYNNRAFCKDKLHDYKGALADYNYCLKLDPSYWNGYFNRGAVKVKIADTLGAIEDYNKVIEINPDHGDAFYERGVLKEGQKKYLAAIEDFSVAIAKDTTFAKAFYHRGKCKNAIGENMDAEVDINKAYQKGLEQKDM